MKQLSLIQMKSAHGLFTQRKSKRKSARPLSTKYPIHIILKSTRHSLRQNERVLLAEWFRLAKKLGIKTYDAVVASNHLHAVIRIHSRRCYRKFISGFTGLVSRRLQIKWKTSPATRIE
ncbi:MAG: hypothetical protein AB7F86_15075 [Bdellovibrionales bacterium]